MSDRYDNVGSAPTMQEVEPEVRRKMAELEKSLECLGMDVGALSNDLSMVLIPAAPDVVSDDKGAIKDVAKSPLTEYFSKSIYKVQAISNRVKDIKRRLEI